MLFEKMDCNSNLWFHYSDEISFKKVTNIFIKWKSSLACIDFEMVKVKDNIM